MRTQTQPAGSGLQQWVSAGDTRYLYDGWRVIQERDANNTPTVSYTRGSDLSGTMEGAGGIGGLLARSTGNGTAWTSHAYYHADGNGNTTCMLDTSQTMVASYRYDPFGNTVSSSGTLVNANVYRFSSKEFHPASGLYYYGYRWYSPSLQRWVSRDPFLEQGFESVRKQLPTEEIMTLRRPAEFLEGPNLYKYAENSPITGRDSNGLSMLWPPGGPPDYDPVPIRPSPPPPPCKRDCVAEGVACAARGMLVCGVFEELLPVRTPGLKKWPFRICMGAYSAVCAMQKAQCDQWNKDHGF